MAANTPTDIARQAIDACAVDFELGDIEQGGRVANVLLRAYGECRAQLLRGAPWDFARQQNPLTLLADGTGQTANVGTVVPGNQFIYEYAYPANCARIRYIPWYPFLNPGVPSSNIAPGNSSSPTMTGLGSPPYIGQRIKPSRYLVTSDPNYSAVPDSSAMLVQGQSPQGNTVILSNVQYATCVYTYDAQYPSSWDHLFRAAMVAFLASEVALPLWADKDRKFGMQLRMQQIEIAKKKILEARIADGTEMYASSDIPVDWMNARNAGAGGGPWQGAGYGGNDYGCWGGGWGGSVSFGDGSAY